MTGSEYCAECGHTLQDHGGTRWANAGECRHTFFFSGVPDTHCSCKKFLPMKEYVK